MAGRRLRAADSTMREMAEQHRVLDGQDAIALRTDDGLECFHELVGPLYGEPLPAEPEGLSGDLDLFEHEDIAWIVWIPEHGNPRQSRDGLFE